MGAALNSNARDVCCIGSQVRQRNIVHVPGSRYGITAIVGKTHCGERMIRSVVEGNRIVLSSSTSLCSKVQERVQGGIYCGRSRQIQASLPPHRSKCDGAAP